MTATAKRPGEASLPRVEAVERVPPPSGKGVGLRLSTALRPLQLVGERLCSPPGASAGLAVSPAWGKQCEMHNAHSCYKGILVLSWGC